MEIITDGSGSIIVEEEVVEEREMLWILEAGMQEMTFPLEITVTHLHLPYSTTIHTNNNSGPNTTIGDFILIGAGERKGKKILLLPYYHY